MSVFDGEPGDLTFEQALVESARAGTYPSEPHRTAVVAAVEKHFQIGNHHPDTVAEVLKNRPLSPAEAEVAALRAEVAELKKLASGQDPRAAEVSEVAALRAEVAELKAGAATGAPTEVDRPAGLGPTFAAPGQ